MHNSPQNAENSPSSTQTAVSDQSVTTDRLLPGTDLKIIPRRLLVVEDHESTATVMQRLLQRHGHKVWVALSYQQALEISAEHSIEALICDLELPDGDGCDLLRELQSISSIQGIVVSGHGTASDLARSRNAGFLAHLVKPFDITQIEHTLSELIPSGISEAVQ
jgi:two-component system CheB/CheR fusion protein